MYEQEVAAVTMPLSEEHEILFQASQAAFNASLSLPTPETPNLCTVTSKPD